MRSRYALKHGIEGKNPLGIPISDSQEVPAKALAKLVPLRKESTGVLWFCVNRLFASIQVKHKRK